eukprot:4203239-Alexandrium_andersonii.AAC.1
MEGPPGSVAKRVAEAKGRRLPQGRGRAFGSPAGGGGLARVAGGSRGNCRQPSPGHQRGQGAEMVGGIRGECRP